MPYSTKRDLELRIGKKNLAELTNDNVGIPIEIPAAPSAALSAVAGVLSAGAYKYKVTFIFASGEGVDSDESSAVTVVTPGTAGQISLTAIPLSTKGATARKLYRTTAGGSTFKYLATISDNTTASYTDNIADASLGSEQASDVVITELISTCDAVIDSFVGQVYDVPLSAPVPEIINRISTDLACVRAMQRRPANYAMPETWKNVEKDTRDLLQKIADQAIELPGVAVEEPEVKAVSPEQTFAFGDPDNPMSQF